MIPISLSVDAASPFLKSDSQEYATSTATVVELEVNATTGASVGNLTVPSGDVPEFMHQPSETYVTIANDFTTDPGRYVFEAHAASAAARFPKFPGNPPMLGLGVGGTAW